MKMKELFNQYFWKYGHKFRERLSGLIGGLARNGKAMTGMIAEAMAMQDKINFEFFEIFHPQITERYQF
jgi:hypothetical protein